MWVDRVLLELDQDDVVAAVVLVFESQSFKMVTFKGYAGLITNIFEPIDTYGTSLLVKQPTALARQGQAQNLAVQGFEPMLFIFKL